MADVSGLISTAQEYTNTLVGQATSAMTATSGAVSAVGYSLPVFRDATLPAPPPATINTDLPTLDSIELVLPSEPSTTLTFQDISPVDVSGAPTLSAAVPTLELPTKPSQVADFGGTMPAINTNIAFPEPPAALLNPLIDAPVLTTHDVPVKPSIMLPAFTSVAPVNDTEAPTNLDVTLANSYATAAPSFVTAMDGYVDNMLAKRNPQYAAQMAAIEAQLTKYLAGGTGLNAAVENAIYERARSKNNAEALRVRNSAYSDAAGRGFTLPTGALMSAMQTARQAAADTNARAAGEIVVMQAEMEQKNLQFAVTTSTGLRTALLNATLSYHQNLVSINGQALDYAKSVLNAIIETYNTAVKVFSIKLEAYKADAQVFEVKLKGAMAAIELYSAEIKALEALVNVDRAQVDIYRARIETLVSMANVYRAQIEAVQGRVGLEKLKLEVFQGQVQAYTSQVQAKNAEWQGYSAAVSGQEAKARIFATQVQAYSAEIGGYSAKIQAKSEAVRAVAATNQARASQYQAVMSGYQTVVQARGEQARTQLAVQGQLINAFNLKVQASIGNAQVQQGYYRATSEIAISNAGGNLKAQLGEIESKRAYGQTLAQLGTANAQIYGSLASSAMAGMNTLVSQSEVQ